MTREEIFNYFQAFGAKVIGDAEGDKFVDTLLNLLASSYAAQAATIALLLPMLEADESHHDSRSDADKMVIEALRGAVSIQLSQVSNGKVDIKPKTVH